MNHRTTSIGKASIGRRITALLLAAALSVAVILPSFAVPAEAASKTTTWGVFIGTHATTAKVKNYKSIVIDATGYSAAEISRLKSGGRKRVAFSLATSRRYRDNNGEQKEQTDWHNIVGWGKIADIVEQLGIRKGMSLYVEGTLTNRSWTDQNGQKRYATEVNMDTFQLLGREGDIP